MPKSIVTGNWRSLNTLNLRRILTGLPPVGLVIRIVLNIGCNARCLMCDGRRYDPGSRFSYASVIRIIKNLDNHTVSAIRLLGGEPLLDKKGLLSVIKKCKKKGIKVLITTNGSLLDTLFLEKIINDGVDEITFSLDAVGKIHDSIRRMPGLSQHIERTICYIRRKYPSIKVKINTVIMKNNYKEITRLINWADKIGVYSVTLHNLRNYGRNYNRLKIGDMKQISLFRNLPKTRAKIEFIGYPDMNNKEDKCNYLFHHLNIMDNGKVIPCHSYDNNSFFLDRPIRYLYRMREFRKYVLNKIMNCQKCSIRDD